MNAKRAASFALYAAVAFFVPFSAHTQDYPSKSIRLVIPFPPGDANDVIGRLVGVKITEALGQQVVIDNRGGAGGSLGVEVAAKAPADGYTLVLGNIANLAVNPTLYKKLAYDPLTIAEAALGGNANQPCLQCRSSGVSI